MVEDEDLLLAVLNSAPVIDGRATDELADDGWASAERFGGTGTSDERRHLRSTREALQGAVRGSADAPARLDAVLADVALVPRLAAGAIRWELQTPADTALAARATLAWSRVQEELPGRLRPCANDECNLFLIDHSRPGTARWCSMATCGNRMKARAFADRRRQGAEA